jgi:hypothetical protein
MIWAVVAALGVLVVLPVVQSLLSDEVRGWLPHLSRKLVSAAVWRMPPEHRARYREEWEADLATFNDRPITALIFALRVCGLAPKTAKASGRVALRKSASQADTGEQSGTATTRVFVSHPDADHINGLAQLDEHTVVYGERGVGKSRVFLGDLDQRIFVFDVRPGETRVDRIDPPA